ncbi:uncharacterized protein FOMMEDRAFT_116419 [Fomitiporia mediterranea MF3/22]|uniref:uncharacterized protein n=1 Tax=Fomitiporia mediterranea (strain MF3/22) TaxID=694068 RepID=UPI0004409C0E|nr:uncharacterized protein FOMMEDRAFT_116419 [Fomitiporia mediterranea MF3/22]EJD07992.1 hypothetical protein FOMMEDRAFT_116419 [Fomitiporia mediterranea MF3/22]
MAYGVKSHKFCCCLPVRFGVFILSSLQLFSSGAVAAGSYYVIITGRYDVEKYKIVAIVTAVIMTLLFLASLLGFIGSILRRLNLVRVFSSTLNWLLGINIIAGIASIVLLFISDKQKIIDSCINGSTDQDVINFCNHVDRYKWTMLGFIVFNWAVQLYECIIVSRYVLQLQEEKEEQWRLSSMKTYTEVPRRDSSEAFMHPSVSYPYADKQHSYGNNTAYYAA